MTKHALLATLLLACARPNAMTHETLHAPAHAEPTVSIDIVDVVADDSLIVWMLRGPREVVSGRIE